MIKIGDSVIRKVKICEKVYVYMNYYMEELAIDYGWFRATDEEIQAGLSSGMLGLNKYVYTWTTEEEYEGQLIKITHSEERLRDTSVDEYAVVDINSSDNDVAVREGQFKVDSDGVILTTRWLPEFLTVYVEKGGTKTLVHCKRTLDVDISTSVGLGVYYMTATAKLNTPCPFDVYVDVKYFWTEGPSGTGIRIDNAKTIKIPAGKLIASISDWCVLAVYIELDLMPRLDGYDAEGLDQTNTWCALFYLDKHKSWDFY